MYPERSQLWPAGGLLVGGLLINIVSTLMHPSGHEDEHEIIFAKYAESGSWVAIHLGQFVGVILALAGLLVLYRALRATGEAAVLATLAAAATVATAATWAVLQGLDGVGLKQAVDAWQSASGPEEERIRLATAEAIRWLEWGFQSYFRLLLGLTFVLFGAAILTGRLLADWLGWTAVLTGSLAVAIGIDVGFRGLASGLQDALSIAFLVLVIAFAGGVLTTGMRERARQAARA